MTNTHGLLALNRVSDSKVEYVCTCGAEGAATQAFPGDDVEKKARLNHKQHAKHAKS